MHQPSGRRQLGLSLALITAFMWGLLPIGLKGALSGMDTVTITWYRFTSAALILGTYYWLRGGFKWQLLRKRRLALLMFIAVAGLLNNYWLYVVGLNYSTAEAAQVIIQLAPLLLLVVSLWLYREPFAPLQIAGICAVVTGIVLFFNLRLEQIAEEATTGNGSYALGLLFIVLAAITWTVYATAQKALLKDFSSQEVLLVIFFAGGIAFLPISSPMSAAKLDALQWGYLIFSMLNTLIAYGAFAYALEHWEASRVSATVTVVPILTVTFVYLHSLILPDSDIAPEPMNLWSWLGAGLVVAGSMTTALVKPTNSPKISP